MAEGWGWPLLLGVLGLVFGSFIATVAIRWPQGRSALRNSTFYAPGSPRLFSLGIRYAFD